MTCLQHDLPADTLTAMSRSPELADRPELWERFWSKVRQNGECWEWTASLSYGYGQFALRHGVIRKAHRISYEWLVGPIPDGLHLDHLCRNRKCVNPEHLEPVTNYVNLHRGQGFTATRAAQTHCIHGHEFTPENTNIKRNGCRECRACVSRRSSEKWKRIKAAREDVA